MRQKQKSEYTKDLILNESFKLFYENGFKTTSVDKIMEQTQLTKGAFYHHYKSKKELGEAVIKSKLKSRIYEGMIIPLYAPGNAIEVLETAFVNRLKSFKAKEKKHGCPMNNLINEIGDFERTYQLALRKLIDEWRKAIVLLVDRGKQEKTIKENVSSAAVATFIISAFEGIRGLRKLYTNDKIIEDYIEGYMQYLNQIKK